MKVIKYVLFLVNIVAVLALFVSYLSPYISPEANRFIPIFGLFYPLLFFINSAFFVFWIFSKWTYSLISGAALLIGMSSMQRFIAFNSPKEIKSDNIIKVSTYNVASGIKMGESSTKKFFDFVEEEIAADLVFFQESSSKIIDGLKEKFPNRELVKVAQKKAIVLSRYPVIKSGSLDFDNNFNTCVWADINYKGKVIRVYSVHLESNRITRIASNVREKGELGNKETWNRVGEMIRLYSRGTRKRSNQTEVLLENIKSIEHSVIVAGDFNDIPQSYLYTQITEELQDAFVTRGSGLGTTFNGAVPALRIDYIFADQSMQVLNYQTHRVKFSDHFAVSSRILVK